MLEEEINMTKKLKAINFIIKYICSDKLGSDYYKIRKQKAT